MLKIFIVPTIRLTNSSNLWKVLRVIKHHASPVLRSKRSCAAHPPADRATSRDRAGMGGTAEGGRITLIIPLAGLLFITSCLTPALAAPSHSVINSDQVLVIDG